MTAPLVLSADPAGDWRTSGAYAVAPGVHRIPLPLPEDALRAVNVYALTGADGVTLIDCGWAIPEAFDVLTEALALIGHEVDDIDDVLVTHVHADHYGHAARLQQEFGVSIGLGAGEEPSLHRLQSEREPHDTQLTALRRLGSGDLADRVAAIVLPDRPNVWVWAEPDRWLAAGPLPAAGRTLEVVPTPGHTTGHVVFHDTDARLLFAGDHVLSEITPSIGYELVPSPDPLGAFLHSLAVVRERPDAHLLPAHGPARDSAHARVDELLHHHAQRLDETERAVLVDGADSAEAVAGRLGWTRRGRALADLDVFNQMLAVLETAAHLRVLVSQGRLPAVPGLIEPDRH